VRRVPTARNDDVDLWFERVGSGPPLLFIGGTGSDLRQRPNVLDGPFPRDFDVVAYDQRTQGRSSDPDRPSTMADFAEDAVAVLDAVGWSGPVDVVGVSFGGMVAQELAIRHPPRVRRVVLACTSSGGAGGSSYPLHELEAMPEPARSATLLAVNDSRLDRAWQEAHPDDAGKLLELASRREPASPRQLEVRRQHDTFERLGQITAPTLVAAGRFDGIAPVANSQALAERIPDARLEVFEGGHLFLVQDRAAVPAVIRFLLAEDSDGPTP
jgi:3-oxoadipate enol-lactonase